MNIFSLYTRSFIQRFFIALLLLIHGSYAFAQSPTVSIASSYPMKLCGDSIVTISFNTTGTFLTGNIFTVELSDPSGSFASPSIIGADTTTTSGSVKCFIGDTLAPGTNYKIRISANKPGYTSASDSVSIGIPPPIISVGSSAPICNGDSLRLTSISTPVVVYSWTGPGGYTSALQNPILFGADTTRTGYFVLTVFSNGCPSFPDSTYVLVIKNTPSIVITPGPTDTICTGDTVTFTATYLKGGTSPTFTWQKNGTTVSTGSAVYITSSLSNNDSVKCIMVSNATCAKPNPVSYKTTMVVNPLPASFTATSNSPVCSTDPISLRAGASSSGATYKWSGPSGYSSTLQNPTISSADSTKAGIYSVNAILNGCKSSIAYDTVVVVKSVLPSLNVIATPSDTLCEGQTITLSASAVNGGAAPVYKWYKNGTLLSLTDSVYATDTLKDGDGIICTMSSSATCPRPVTVSYSNIVTVKPLPVIISVSGNSPLCSHDTMKLHVTATPPTSTFIWSGPRGFSSTSANPVYAPIDSSNEGNYYVRAYSNGCQSDLSTVSMIVSNDVTPTVSISVYPGPILLPGKQATFYLSATNTGTNPTYQWKKDGFDIPGAGGTSYTTTGNLRNEDSISVTLISSATCANPFKVTSNYITMYVAQTAKFDDQLSLYPNPSTGTLIIKGIDTVGKQVEVSVFNVAGQLMYHTTSPVSSSHLFYLEVNLSGVPDGNYFVHIITDSEKQISPITIKH